MLCFRYSVVTLLLLLLLYYFIWEQVNWLEKDRETLYNGNNSKSSSSEKKNGGWVIFDACNSERARQHHVCVCRIFAIVEPNTIRICIIEASLYPERYIRIHYRFGWNSVRFVSCCRLFFPFLLLSMSYVIYSKPDLSVMRIYITCHFNCCHNFIPLVNFSFYISHSLIFASLSIINAFRLLICMYSFWFNSMWFDSVFALTSIPMLI